MLLPRLKIQLKLDGKIVVRKRFSHSWTKNHWMWIFSIGTSYPLYTANSLAIVDTSGTSRGCSAAQHYLPVPYVPESYWSAGVSTEGIVIGTGNTAEDFDDYALAAQIVHGVGAGQMSYGAISNPPGVSGNFTMQWSRSFINNSGANIVVAEIGIILREGSGYYGSGKYFLMARDVLSPSVTVANGQTLTVTYDIAVAYPS
jgi:hypothetical protein